MSQQPNQFSAQYDAATSDTERDGVLRSVMAAAKKQFGKASGQFQGFEYDASLDHPAVTRYGQDGARTLYDGAIITHDGDGMATVSASRIGITGISGKPMPASQVSGHFYVANSSKEVALRDFMEQQDTRVSGMRLRPAA